MLVKGKMRTEYETARKIRMESYDNAFRSLTRSNPTKIVRTYSKEPEALVEFNASQSTIEPSSTTSPTTTTNSIDDPNASPAKNTRQQTTTKTK